jgi:hypothetical protein
MEIYEASKLDDPSQFVSHLPVAQENFTILKILNILCKNMNDKDQFLINESCASHPNYETI